jgi:DNA-binding XRE family transcriptional regulator
MEKVETCWERIEMIIWCYDFNNVSELAHYLGLKRPENLYQIKRGNNNISLSLADKICKKFPHVNKCWLFCGKGDMLKNHTG